MAQTTVDEPAGQSLLFILALGLSAIALVGLAGLTAVRARRAAQRSANQAKTAEAARQAAETLAGQTALARDATDQADDFWADDQRHDFHRQRRARHSDGTIGG